MESAYYRLKDGYLLRGWEKLPFAVVDRRTMRPVFLERARMRAMLLCDGAHDLTSSSVADAERATIAEAQEKGWVEPCAQGEGLSEDQRYRVYPVRYVSSAHWSITGRCNYRCLHCMMSAPEGKLGQLSLAALLRIVDQLEECGILRVSLTGGEALIRPDFPEVVRACVGRGIVVTQLYTNGALLDGGVLDVLADAGQHPEVIISFDGVGWHDWLRGVDGAERLADRAFELCRERGFSTRAQVTLHRNNAGSLRETMRHLADMGCSAVRVSPVSEEGDWVDNANGLTFSPEEYLEAVLSYVPDYYADGCPVPLVLSNAVVLDPAEPDSFKVAATKHDDKWRTRPILTCADRGLQILADGTFGICNKLGSEFLDATPIVSDDPSARTVPLVEALADGSPFMQAMDLRCSDLAEAPGACSGCAYFERCLGGCRASAYEATGDILAPDPSACAFFENGWEARVAEAVRAARPEAVQVF